MGPDSVDAGQMVPSVPPLSLSSVDAPMGGDNSQFKGRTLPSAKAPSAMAFVTDSPRRLGQLSGRIQGLENDWMKESQSRCPAFFALRQTLSQTLKSRVPVMPVF
jgi:hypothetical protein